MGCAGDGVLVGVADGDFEDRIIRVDGVVGGVANVDFEDRSVRVDGVVGVVADFLRDDRDLGLGEGASSVTLRRVAGEADRGAFIGVSWSTPETLKAVLVVACAYDKHANLPRLQSCPFKLSSGTLQCLS
jgi:hypothetical protein